MKSVLLRLEGPIQAWATQSKLGVRDTDREPSKSGVLGLVGCALGMERDDDRTLALLRSLSLAVRVDRPGSLLRDYHTAGGGRFRGTKYFVEGASDCIPSQRYYLQDAAFTAALCGDDALVDRIVAALRDPHWPIYLGRKACVPSAPVLLGVVSASASDAVRGATLVDRRDPPLAGQPERLRLVLEAPPEEGGEPRYDEPLSFRVGAKRYGVRYVKTEWLEVAAAASPTAPLGGAS
ncbi:MAG: type I-E CRISPR-associated protein Cas5/CasD [Sandaracinaceae bacterium]